MDVISKNIAQKKNEIDLLSSKIKSKEVEKSIWETKKENYKLKSGKYGELSVLAENTIEKDKQEINFINKQVDNLKTCIEKCKKSIEQCVKDIEQNKIRIALKNNEIGELHSEEINNKKMLDTIIEKELKPMFQSLKEFYKSQSITRILRIK